MAIGAGPARRAGGGPFGHRSAGLGSRTGSPTLSGGEAPDALVCFHTSRKITWMAPPTGMAMSAPVRAPRAEPKAPPRLAPINTERRTQSGFIRTDRLITTG